MECSNAQPQQIPVPITSPKFFTNTEKKTRTTGTEAQPSALISQMRGQREARPQGHTALPALEPRPQDCRPGPLTPTVPPPGAPVGRAEALGFRRVLVQGAVAWMAGTGTRGSQEREAIPGRPWGRDAQQAAGVGDPRCGDHPGYTGLPLMLQCAAPHTVGP